MPRTRHLIGRTVLVTGAARGVGELTARRLHALGANVALVGLEPERLERVAVELGDGRAIWSEADVVDGEALATAVETTLTRFGGLDVAVANAGLHFVGNLADAPAAQLEREIEVNLLGTLRTDRAVLPALAASRGYLLNIASLAALSHLPLMGAYAASKAGVEALTNCLRMEVAHTGVGVGCAYLGFFDTDLVRGSYAHPSTERIERLLPGFVRRPARVSRAVAAIVDGILRRRARVWAPRYLGPALLLRGVVQPLTEARTMRSPRLHEAVRLAAEAEEQDDRLGVAAVSRR